MIKKLSSIIISVSLILWTALFILQLIQFQEANKISYFASKIEFFIHVATLFFMVKIYIKTSLINKRILFWLMIGDIGIFLNDTAFYYFIYFSNNYVAKISSLKFMLIMLPFFVWAIAIIVFFYKILRTTFQSSNFNKILLVFLILNSTVIFLCFSSIPYATRIWGWQNILQLIGFITESIIFDLVILCLIYSKNSGLSWIATGFAILITGDFLLTYTHLTQTDNTLGIHGELFWLLGLLCMLFGIYHIKNNAESNVKSWLKEANSIKHIFAFWTFRISTVSILPGFIFAYYFLPINKEVFLLLPPILIIYSIILVFFSLFMGRHFETPFKQIENNIDALMLKNDKSQVKEFFTIKEFIFLQKFLDKAILSVNEKERAKQTLIDVAVQVAHDMQSPLAVFNLIIKKSSSGILTIQERLLMHNAYIQIHNIATDLVTKYKEKPSDCNSVIFVYILLNEIICEKEIEYNNSRFKFELIIDATSSAFSLIKGNDTDMRRMLSNLINNAVNAMPLGGTIQLQCRQKGTNLQILIIDQGCGLSAQRITMLLSEESHRAGIGLGLKHSKDYLKQQNGSIHISSIESKGTSVILTLPSVLQPSWLAVSLIFNPTQSIFIIDDDKNIHFQWKQKFTAFPNLIFHDFYTISSARDALKTEVPGLIFCDYEFYGKNETGLDFFKDIQSIKCFKYLVTRHIDAYEIFKKIDYLNIKIIPKQLLEYISIIEK